jgi:RND family efflux transporter MFP subunit
MTQRRNATARARAGWWRTGALGLALVACGGGEKAGAPGAGPGARGPGGGESRIVPVEVAVAELGTAARIVTGTGTVEPVRTIGINSQVTGALLQVAVQEGDVVRPGAVLARIDSRELNAQLRSAEAALLVAKRAAERSEQLRAQEIITVAEYERDQAALAAAQATRDQLGARVGYATVRSPIAGVVLEKRVETGNVVAANTPLFTVANLSMLVVRVPISELDVTALDAGDAVTVSLDALPGRTLAGRIRRIFPAADSTTRLVPVEVELTGAAARDVRPGFLARVSFQLAPRTDVLMVPAGAVVQDGSGEAVFVLQQGKASRTAVARGGTFQGRVEITRGLSAGDTVVVAGNSSLRDGAAVRVVRAPELPAPEATVRQGASVGTP